MTLWRSSLSLDSVKDILTILQSIRTTSFVPEDRNEVANANATIRGRQANTGDGVVHVFDLISHGGLIQISRFDHDGPLSPLEQKFSTGRHELLPVSLSRPFREERAFANHIAIRDLPRVMYLRYVVRAQSGVSTWISLQTRSPSTDAYITACDLTRGFSTRRMLFHHHVGVSMLRPCPVLCDLGAMKTNRV